MNDFSKIGYYDLLHEARHNRLPETFGRELESERLIRICGRKSANNAIIVGPGGIGKTAAIFALASKLLLVAPESIMALIDSMDLSPIAAPTVSSKYTEAMQSLPNGIIIFENIGSLLFHKQNGLDRLTVLLDEALRAPTKSIIMTMQPQELEWIKAQNPRFLELFEVVELKAQPQFELNKIISIVAKRLAKKLTISNEIIEYILEQTKRFKQLGVLPGSAVKVLDESVSLARTDKSPSVTLPHVQKVLADRTGIPESQIAATEHSMLAKLETKLNTAVVGQGEPLKHISNTIKRAKLGLKNPNRPLGSFLLLGPSGVGKTETAKTVAKAVFGKEENFTRIDMSEFSESHTVQRLVGAPPGYVGHEAGGEMTNPIKKEPYNLLLLDEIEKANPKIFDIFLQVLDDGRLTSGQGETIDFTNTILMATSNIGVDAIIAAEESGMNIHSPLFKEQHLLPILAQTFRVEFLNRFDAILVFNPLSEQALFNIAKLEIKKIEQRVKKHAITFAIKSETLQKRVKELRNPRLGARPIKRYVEETCETLVANKLLSDI